MVAKISLRQPTPSDEHAFVSAARRSRALHRPWTTAPCDSAQFRSYVERMSAPGNAGFLVCDAATNDLAGVINVTNVVRGLFCSAYLGYYAFAGHERQGLMKAGLHAVVRQVFGPMKLHRLEANIQPGNAASIALVASCGFAKEGYSPRYLKIGGRWRDHERWALVKA